MKRIRLASIVARDAVVLERRSPCGAGRLIALDDRRARSRERPIRSSLYICQDRAGGRDLHATLGPKAVAPHTSHCPAGTFPYIFRSV